MKQAVRNLLDGEDGFLTGKTKLIMDRDPVFTKDVRTLLRGGGVRDELGVHETGASPNPLFRCPKKRGKLKKGAQHGKEVIRSPYDVHFKLGYAAA